jgi:hypothetical protein
MNKRLILGLIMCVVVGISGCATMGIEPTVGVIQIVNAEAEPFRNLMTEFLKNWPLLSGAVEGSFASHPSDVSLAMRLGRERIDEAWARGKDGIWDQRDLGLAFGCAMDLFNRAFMDWLGQAFPSLLKLVPIW